jgi:hypothetical protein
MWEFILRAPNGLQHIVRLDDMMIEHTAGDPVKFMLENLHISLAGLYTRRKEKNPNEEQTDDNQD